MSSNVQPMWGGLQPDGAAAGWHRAVGLTPDPQTLSDEIRSRLYTDRVAIAGGTREARRAGPSTASWPSSHRLMQPTGT